MPQVIPLSRRVITASAWSLVGYGVSLAIRFGSNLIMTRLLVPEMFGVMAVATIMMVGLNMFSDLGLRQSIVQSQRGSEPTFLNTAWVMQIARGIALWIIALIISSMIYVADRDGLIPPSSAYADPALPGVIAVLSFSMMVIGGFGSTKVAEASRNLALDRITQIELVGQIFGLLCMLIWVSIDRSIWALVIASVGASLVRVLLSHIWLKGTPNRWQWDETARQELVDFGKWIFLSSVLGFLVGSSDRLILGWMVNSSLLGIYAIAFLILNSVEIVLVKIIGDVAYPALSEVARDNRNLKAAYYRLHVVIGSIAYCCAGFLITSGSTLVALFYDHRYAQAGWMLEILAVGLILTPFYIAMQAFMAVGKPHLLSRILAVRLLILFLGMPVGFQFFGLAGALWAAVASQLLCLPMFLYFGTKHGLLDLGKELLVLPLLIAGAAIGKMTALVLGA